MSRVTKNLSLDPAAVERGERYSERHSTSLSKVVSDFLLRLPLDEAPSELSPIVRRLRGIAKGDVDEDDYHRHLLEKYGR
ncbi:MAG TPA: DUF6364 family protein [Longimicrobium sp.]|jgi:hypothetical protein